MLTPKQRLSPILCGVTPSKPALLYGVGATVGIAAPIPWRQNRPPCRKPVKAQVRKMGSELGSLMVCGCNGMTMGSHPLGLWTHVGNIDVAFAHVRSLVLS